MRSRNILFFVVLLIGCLTQFASDIYTPAIPAIAKHLETTLNQAQWSLAIYMAGVAISQLFYGVISEGIGRKKPLLAGLIIMLAGSLLCSMAPNIEMLILGRLIQGAGAGACATMWRTIFRDTFTGNELAKYSSYLTAAIIFIVPTAPALGAYLLHYFSWRATFLFLTGYTIIAALFVLFSYQETSKYHHTERLKYTFIKTTFRELLVSRVFMGTTLTTFTTYGALFSWITAGPVLLIHLGGMTPIQYGWLGFFGGGGAYALSGLLNGKLVERFGMSNMMRFGWSMMLLSGLLLFIGYFILGTKVWFIATTMVLFYFGSTFIFPNANARALSPFGKIAGYAAALYGFVQIAGAAILGGLISYIPETNQLPLAVLVLVVSSISWLGYELIVEPKVKSLHSSA